MSHAVNYIPANFKSTLPPRKRAKTQEEKEQRRIERILRNRKAAHQSREKKRLHLMYLEKKCSLLERIMSHVDLGHLVGTSSDPSLRKVVTEYEAVVKEGMNVCPAGSVGTPSFMATTSDGDDMDESSHQGSQNAMQVLGQPQRHLDQAAHQETRPQQQDGSHLKSVNGDGTPGSGSTLISSSGLSVSASPNIKSPSMSGTTPGSPCTTVVGGVDDCHFEHRKFVLDNSESAVLKTEPMSSSSDSYSYSGSANYHTSFSVFEDSDPRVYSGNNYKSTNESWNLLLTQSHYPLNSGNIFKDDINESFELTDSSMDLDHWRDPAVIVHWRNRYNMGSNM